MNHEITHRKRNICSNCGKTGHEFRICREPITSYGLINIKLTDDLEEPLVMKDKFSSSKNIYYRIISKKYSNISCYMSSNLKLYNHQQTYRLITILFPLVRNMYRSFVTIKIKFCL